MTEYQDSLIVLTEADGTELIVARAEVDPDIKQIVAEMIVLKAEDSRPSHALLDLVGRTSLAYAAYVAEEAVKMLATYWLMESTPALIGLSTRKLENLAMAYRAIKHQQTNPPRTEGK